jgi:uncharacterized membrane protein YedE/YeeE
MRQIGWAFLAGFIFGGGLFVSGMTEPERIRGFLDVLGRWDPSLAFVMVGALGVHWPLRMWIERGQRPRFADSFSVPPPARVDRKLIVGACIFGLGWGSSGYCPGPAVTSLARSGAAAVALLGIVLGILLHEFTLKRVQHRTSDLAPLPPRNPADLIGSP